MTVYFNQTLDIPYAGMILRRNPVNISILAGNDDIVLVLYDPSGSQYDFSIAAGQKILQRNFDLFRFEVTGSGQAAIAISYPEVIEPSIEITLNPNLPQSVSSPQLPASLDSNGFFKTRYLGSTDNPYVLINSGEVTLEAYDFTTNTKVATVPTGEIWTLLGVTILGVVAVSGSATLAGLGILRSNETSIPGIVGSNYIPHALLVMSYASDSPVGGTTIVGSASVAESSTNIYQYSVQQQWAKNPILYPGDEIYFVASNFSSNSTNNSIYISYSKQTIP